jgi:hypothetical protein
MPCGNACGQYFKRLKNDPYTVPGEGPNITKPVSNAKENTDIISQ